MTKLSLWRATSACSGSAGNRRTTRRWPSGSRCGTRCPNGWRLRSRRPSSSCGRVSRACPLPRRKRRATTSSRSCSSTRPSETARRRCCRRVRGAALRPQRHPSRLADLGASCRLEGKRKQSRRQQRLCRIAASQLFLLLHLLRRRSSARDLSPSPPARSRECLASGGRRRTSPRMGKSPRNGSRPLVRWFASFPLGRRSRAARIGSVPLIMKAVPGLATEWVGSQAPRRSLSVVCARGQLTRVRSSAGF
mmetsp:Transcript_56337/g.125711  ORF Transcript_56337/g.125711 Transcript_56337/m.125711 type:complete len:250 (+) Transcript_56337:4155-4904(+)